MTPRYLFPKRYADFAQRLRAPAGFLLLGMFVWRADPSRESLALGAPISIAGLALRAWAAGHLEKNRTLARGGPYARTRNPLYVGTALVAAGLVGASRRPELAVLFTAAFALLYLPVIELEEQHLRKLFPEYAEYARHVPRLWFRMTAAKSRERFRPALYLKNEEYKAAVGFLAAVALLVWKMW
ncbi:MAG TPA: isoprenylcysteine carboxylmethyltransferase family protein [Bryobacteraceae bacterium]|nr:isoprenylcysteine carboxylmethyltransferase family protein [Bryobacteraceae bacterium]